jgi:hypothetical protein
MLRHIAWFNEAPIEPAPTGALTSSDARVRRRCLVPARELESLGIECSVFGNLKGAEPAHVAKHLQKLETDIVVIGRMTGPSLLALARTAKHLGCYVIADFAGAGTLSPDQKKLAELADQIVTASEEEAEDLRHSGLSVLAIPDCDEQATGKQAPHAIALLWLDGFKKLKMKPPACANTNEPLATNG